MKEKNRLKLLFLIISMLLTIVLGAMKVFDDLPFNWITIGMPCLIYILVMMGIGIFKNSKSNMPKDEPNPYSNNKEKPFDIHRGKNFYTDEFRNFN